MQIGQAPTYTMDLTAQGLPEPRLHPVNGNATTIDVPLYTDFKLHDICGGPSDPNAELLNQNQPAGSDSFFAGNRLFLTKRLWDVGSKPNHYHHGKYTTIRESILAHAGEAADAEKTFAGLSAYDQDSIIEFLKSLKVLPPGARALAIDEDGNPVQWPPK
ncbi:MAG TPA: di-heme oxidoredictase family protein [Bryobacteraceae bacterium]|nr:di-heme oxidoredictase family protein [Bryobacteraceae bacterium]